MRRLVMMVLLAACLVAEAGPVGAQATTDQLSKLSLEALTTPAPGGNPGPTYRQRSTPRPSYAGSGYARSSYARSGRAVRGRTYARRGGYARTASVRRHGSARHAVYRSRHGDRRVTRAYGASGYAPFRPTARSRQDRSVRTHTVHHRPARR